MFQVINQVMKNKLFFSWFQTKKKNEDKSEGRWDYQHY